MTLTPVVLRGTTVAGLFAVILGAISTRPHHTVGAPPDEGATRRATPQRERAAADLARVPLVFEANRGQTAAEVRYLARTGSYTVHLTPSNAVIAPRGAATGHDALRMAFSGGAAAPRIEALDDQPTKVHYYRGSDPGKWLRDVPTYGRVAYREVYPGVDAVFYGNPRSLEFDFVVAPGADARNIQLAFEGADRMEIDSNGALRLHNAAGQVVLGRPAVYQMTDGKRHAVEGGYVLQSPSRVGFRLAAYDAAQPLVIDPYVEVYLTYVGGGGGEGDNSGEGTLSVDSQGHVFVSGGTNSAAFPFAHVVTTEDVFVVKLNRAGSGPAEWAAVIGGGAGDASTASAVGPDGDLYIAGKTASGDFPPMNGISHPSGGAFVAKLDGDTGALQYTSVLGGGSQDEAYGVAVDPDGNAYVLGTTNAAGLPTKSPDPAGPYKTVPVSREYFVAKFDPDLVGDPSFVYLTFLGGNGFDETRMPVIDVDALGFAYVTGRLGDPAGFQTVNGLPDAPAVGAFAAKLNQAGSQLVYATYLAGTAEGTGIAVDVDGNAYITGGEVGGFVAVDELTANSCATSDRFIVKLSFDDATATLSRPFASCVDTTSVDVAVDGAARIHLGQALIDLAKPPAQRIVYSHIGPGGEAVAVDAFCSAYIGGRIDAGMFTLGTVHGPLGPFQPGPGGNWDTYAAKIGYGGPLAYISNFDKDRVTVLDTATGLNYDLDPFTVGVQAEITVGDGPFGVAADPVNARVWVTNQLGDSVSAINTDTHVPVPIMGFSSPAGVAVSPDGAWVFVANKGNHTVSIIDAGTKTVAHTVALPAASSPLGVAVRDVNGTLTAFVTNEGTGSLSVVTLVAGVPSVATYALGMSGPAGIAVTSGPAPKIYVANGWASSLSVIDGLSLVLLDTLIVGDNPFGVAIAPDDSRAYVTNGYPLGASGGNTVSVIDTATDDIVPLPFVHNQIEVGGWPQGIAVHPDGTRVYVANSLQIPCNGCPAQLPGTEDFGMPPGDDVGHTLSIINAATNTTAVSIPMKLSMADWPRPIAFGNFIAPLSAAFDPGCVPGQALMQTENLGADVGDAVLPAALRSWLANEVSRMAKAIRDRRFATADLKVDRFVAEVRKQERRGKIPKRLAQSFVESAELVSKNLPQGLGDIPRHRLRAHPPDPIRDKSVLASFDTLENRIAETEALSDSQRASLLQRLTSAEGAYTRGEVCTAANTLRSYLNVTQNLRRGELTATAEKLHNDGWMLRRAMLAAHPAEACAGPAFVNEADVSVSDSDNRHVAGRITFPAPRLLSTHRGGEQWTWVDVPGLADFGDPAGFPGVPVLRRLVAVPRGANVAVRATPRTSETLRMNLYPFQPSPDYDQTPDGDEKPPDSAFAEKPFAKDAAAYASNAFTPPVPCTVNRVGGIRDLEVALLECAAAEYNPATDEMHVHSNIEFDVTFSEGTGVFITDRSLGPFEPDIDGAAGATLNGPAIRRYVGDGKIHGPCLGEELLILTHPDFSAQALQLAEWKRAKGITTNVFHVADMAGPAPDTAQEIDAFIEDRYDNCAVRPSYVLLFGDAAYVPTFYQPNIAAPEILIATDFPYAVYAQLVGDIVVGDIYPEFAVGRITVKAPEQAQIVVDKTIAYESNPPNSDTFYDTALLASQFQCCRADIDAEGAEQMPFIQNAEFLRDHLTFQGKTVQRVYTTTVDMTGNPDADPPIPPYEADPTPRLYKDGVSTLPAALGPGFAWNGDTADIMAGWNEGRFLAIHVDHGWRQGWAHPSFDTSHVADLTNGALQPVVLNVNCSTGYFDHETDHNPETEHQSLAETLLYANGKGAVGVIAGSRTLGWPSFTMLKGMIDSVWPATVPWGGAQSSRLGDILNHGKIYMTVAHGYFGNIIEHLKRYTAFGDPTLTLWKERPAMLDFGFTASATPNGIIVNYGEEGATITAMQETPEGVVPVGRGVVRDGVASIEYFVAPSAGAPVLLAASRDGAISRPLTTRQRQP